MATQRITSPIDIETTDRTCKKTCFYSFDYANSSCQVTHNDTYLTFSYDESAKQQSTVIYNDANCTVQDIRLYKPSINEYYGKQVAAELIINHTVEGGNNLIVCVPIIETNDKSASNTLFSQIIPNIPPNTGTNDTVSINVTNYTLNNIVPRGPYYSYVGTLPYDDFNGTYNILIFDSAKVYANMSQTDMNTLGSLIGSFDPTVTQNIVENNGQLFYNSTGTTSDELVSSDDIYISCNPVDSSGSIIVPAPGTSTTDSSSYTSEIEDNLILVGGIIAGIGLIWVATKVYDKIKNRTS